MSVKQKLPWKVLLVVTFGGTSGMVIWVGDNNLLFTLPVFLGFFFLCTQGERLGRLAVGLIFFCLIMSVCAMLDTYLFSLNSYDIITRLARPVVFGLLLLLSPETAGRPGGAAAPAVETGPGTGRHAPVRPGGGGTADQ